MNTEKILDTRVAEEYRQAVALAAAGQEIESRQLRELLMLSGQSIGDYRQHIAAVKARTVAAEQLRGATALTAEIAAAESEQQAAGVALTVANQQAEPLVRAAREAAIAHEAARRKTDALRQRQRDARNAAQRELRKSADPNLDKEIEKLQQQRQQLTKSISGARHFDLEEHKQRLQSFVAKRDEHLRREEPVEARLVGEKIPAMEKHVRLIEEMQQQTIVEEQQVAELDRQIEALEQRKLDVASINWGKCLPEPAAEVELVTV